MKILDKQLFSKNKFLFLDHIILLKGDKLRKLLEFIIFGNLDKLTFNMMCIWKAFKKRSCRWE